jgi:hypothetical protein
MDTLRNREWIAHKAQLAAREKNAAAGKTTKARHYWSCDESESEDDDDDW